MHQPIITQAPDGTEQVLLAFSQLDLTCLIWSKVRTIFFSGCYLSIYVTPFSVSIQCLPSKVETAAFLELS